MGAPNTVEINIVDLEILKKAFELYKKAEPDWQKKIYGELNIVRADTKVEAVVELTEKEKKAVSHKQ